LPHARTESLRAPEAETDEFTIAAPAETRSRASRWWRGLTGSLAAGLVVLAVVVLGAGLICLFVTVPGPGTTFLIAHPVAAIIGVAAQRVADRKEGRLAGLAGVVVLADVAVALWLLWWA
jgi:predicted lipid-binding transport protein (Tim44 family)